MTNLENNDINNENLSEGESLSFVPVSVNKTSNMPVRRQLAIVALLLLGIFSFGASALWLGGDSDNGGGMTASLVQSEELDENETDVERISFDDLEILAQSAIVIDVQTDEVLYQKSPDESLPLASITKLMTALVASEVVEANDVIPITANALDQAGDSGLQSGERFSYKSLIDLVLLTSSNDGAYALSAYVGGALDSYEPEVAFVKAMNVRAKELGLSQTSFRNPTGLDISETEAGAYGSARDVAKLMKYILESSPELLEATTYIDTSVYSESGTLHKADNTNYVVDAIPNTIASKTGYTTLSGGNLVVAFNVGLNRPVIAVVLGSTHQGRFSDILKLVEATKSEIMSGE
ncbi:D-alanyl-D-alanine carboxypeptidase [Candidatus Nomurabacteria bacterium]|nr:D-alanyl-D-alanine carboxypeptidase [Candidatus Nomurabacteria bacterium]MCB9819208.1 D-alanyl-D-alanine carboxypeptidase [Candidatus Nomurabacteria bacterium]